MKRLVLIIWLGLAFAGCQSRGKTDDCTMCASPLGPSTTPTPPLPTVSLCTYAVAPTTVPATYGAKGENGSFIVSTNPQSCTWTAVLQGNPGFVNLRDKPGVGAVNVTSVTHTGNGSVDFVVAANIGGARSAVAVVTSADKTFSRTVTISQAAP